MAEPIEMPFGRLTHMGLRNRVLDGDPDRIQIPTGRGIYMCRPIVVIPQANVPAQRTRRTNEDECIRRRQR